MHNCFPDPRFGPFQIGVIDGARRILRVIRRFIHEALLSFFWVVKPDYSMFLLLVVTEWAWCVSLCPHNVREKSWLWALFEFSLRTFESKLFAPISNRCVLAAWRDSLFLVRNLLNKGLGIILSSAPDGPSRINQKSLGFCNWIAIDSPVTAFSLSRLNHLSHGDFSSSRGR